MKARTRLAWLLSVAVWAFVAWAERAERDP